ncbi:uncharacterized protein LOC124920731 isoform X2 [Impatiens glandulifera]|uniref:uncharacterized protein LOC124920731 isoform X2 n=1 Tax=Impatiens glandulifera TaxID=253017 RepID=UPI001FB0AAD5|nr:uncharacterized protein LOC124920731 isoform X2 [Impatiens glandulifera]
MNSIFQAFSSQILSRAGHGIAKSSILHLSFPSWKRNFGRIGIRAGNVEFPFTTFRVQYYSCKRKEKKSPSVKLVLSSSAVEKEEEEEKDSFFVVRKGDIIGVYKNFNDIQPQIGSSVIDPPVSVFKGVSMSKEAEEYLLSRGLRNALYSINAADFKDDILGPLLPCTIQDPSPTKVDETITNITSTEMMLEVPKEAAVTSSCILHFDGASKGNPGPAGAGAILRNADGSLICRVREGLGTVTNNVAEYRAVILGMKCALKNGYTNIKILGDSKLVCMQLEQRWKVRNKNISILYSEAKKLKDEFSSFEISHILRSFNGDADAEANLGVGLADGEIQEAVG